MINQLCNTNYKQLLKQTCLALTLIVIVASLSQAFVLYTFTSQEDNAELINLSGRQRMLSQSIVKNLLTMRLNTVANSSIKQNLNNNVQLFITNHNKLVKIKLAKNQDSDNKTKMSNMYNDLQPHYKQLLKQTETLSHQKPSSPEKIKRLLAAEQRYLSQMDNIVSLYTSLATAKLRYTKLISLSLYILLLVSLALAAKYILFPAIYNIQKLITNLQEQECELQASNDKLNIALDDLNENQLERLESAKNEVLTSAIGSVAHDINTPLGICLTSATCLQDTTNNLSDKFDKGKITQSDLKKYIELENESNQIMQRNLNNAIELVRSFKVIAVDQGSKHKRNINLSNYIDDILLALKPRLKKTQHNIAVYCPIHLELSTYPSAYYQIFTNLIMNSIIHGFTDISSGEISINIEEQENELNINYSDNGCGLSQENLDKIFEAFFTTKRNSGGSGLGTQIIYKLVTNDLQGNITCKSKPNEGCQFNITVPITLK